MGLCADNLYSLSIDNVTGVMAWVASISYTLQIYYDFSGYSDMAIGLGKMFGFDFKENFDYPYTSFHFDGIFLLVPGLEIMYIFRWAAIEKVISEHI